MNRRFLKTTRPQQQEKLTPQQRQKLLEEIGRKLNDYELVQLHKAVNNPLIKAMAMKELKNL